MVTLAGLEAYYKFNDDGTDSSDHSRDLSFSGTEAYATGLFNNGYSLTGVDTNFATGPTDAALNFAGVGAEYTIAVWVNFTTLSGEQTLVEKFVGASGPGWTLTKLGDAVPNDVFRFAANTTIINTTNLATTGSFLHLVVRSDGTNVEIFFNGVSAGTAATPVISPTSNPLLIGEREGAQSFPVNGVIDEVSLWSRGLLDSDIAQLYNSGSGLELENFIPSVIPAVGTPFRYVRDATLLTRDSTPFRYIREAALVPRDSTPFRYTRGTPFTTAVGPIYNLAITEIRTRSISATYALILNEFRERSQGTNYAYEIGKFFEGLIQNRAITVGTLDTDRLVDIPIQILSSRFGVNMTQSFISELLVVPTGKIAIIMGILFEATVANSIAVPAIVSLGIASGENDIFAAEPMQSFDTAGETWSNWLVFSSARAATAGQSIKLNLTGATATTLISDIHLIGFLA